MRIVPRTAAGAEFHALLASADVVLHPFPFGGSKTAADGLALGLPVVTLVGDALPGRMAYSLYRTMGLDGTGERGCCVATDRERWVYFTRARWPRKGTTCMFVGSVKVEAIPQYEHPFLSSW